MRDPGVVATRYAFGLSSDVKRLVHARTGELRVCDADRGDGMTFDLSPLAPALRLPDSGELWQRLGAAYGAPCLFVTQTPAQLREALPVSYGGDEVTVEVLTEAIAAARLCPRLPNRVRLIGAPAE